MSLHMIFTLIQLLPLKTSSLANTVEAVSTNEGWSFWIYLLFSKGIYSILVTLILGCCLFNLIKNKFGDKDSELDVTIDVAKWVETFWRHVNGYNIPTCGTIMKTPRVSGLALHTMDLEEEICGSYQQSILEKLVTAEGEMEALKNALDITRKSGLDLEENLHELENDKEEVEGRVIVEKKWRELEIQNYQKDMENLQAQMQVLKQEKMEVLMRCKDLQEEAHQAGEALRKRQEMQEKLDEALLVVSALRQAVADLESERDEVIASMSSKSEQTSNVKTNSEEKITEVMYTTARRNVNNSASTPARLEDIHLIGCGDDFPNANQENPSQWVYCDDQGFDVMMSSWSDHQDEGTTEIEESDTLDETASSRGKSQEAIGQSEDIEYEQEEDAMDRVQLTQGIQLSQGIQLTKSAAFRRFLQSNFGQY